MESRAWEATASKRDLEAPFLLQQRVPSAVCRTREVGPDVCSGTKALEKIYGLLLLTFVLVAVADNSLVRIFLLLLSVYREAPSDPPLSSLACPS